MLNTVITFKKTVVGWYNFTEVGVFQYNIDPDTFRNITGVSKQARMGTCEVTTEELAELEQSSKTIVLANGWEVVPDDSHLSHIS